MLKFVYELSNQLLISIKEVLNIYIPTKSTLCEGNFFSYIVLPSPSPPQAITQDILATDYYMITITSPLIFVGLMRFSPCCYHGLTID